MRKKIWIIALLFCSCSQWNVVFLRSHQFTFIPHGDSAGKVFIKTDENGLQELSNSVGIYDNRICISDNVMKRIQILDSGGDPELIIGSSANIDTKKIKCVNFTFNTIGAFIADSDGNLYIQNKLSQQKDASAASNEIDIAPSYILVFNRKGDLQYTLGQKGTPDIPFYHIESMDVDGDGRLFVVTRQTESWNVYQYKGKHRIFFVNLSSLQFIDKEGSEEYSGKIENIKMFENGEKFIISVAHYQDLRLTYRKLYEYSIKDNKLGRVMMTIPDPRNVLFNVINDRLACFWNIESNQVRFMYCNMEGSIMKNVQMNIDIKNNYYTKIISDKTGSIYSYSVTKSGVQILQWE